MAVYESMQELIGNTPLVRLTKLGLPPDARLYAKLETYNPAGSVKDRVGKYMIDASVKDHLIMVSEFRDCRLGQKNLRLTA